MKLINHTVNETIVSGNAKVEMINNILSFSLDDMYYVDDRETYITNYCQYLDTLSFTSVLIGGLGLGLIPFFLYNNMNITDIDILENNQGVIDIISQMSYLNTDINIINQDARTFNTSKTYDLILMDLWWFDDQTFIDDKASILSNYNTNLNADGKFYFPISNEII